jgi:hypothetical protein
VILLVAFLLFLVVVSISVEAMARLDLEIQHNQASLAPLCSDCDWVILDGDSLRAQGPGDPGRLD